MKNKADPSTVWKHLWFIALGLATHNLPVLAQSTAADSAAVAATVRAYHEAVARGDSAAALRLLAADAQILESGAVETREEYRSHHLTADIEFAHAVPANRSALQVTLTGDVAWASATSTMQGSFRGQAVNLVGAELVVLSKTAAGWVIRAIHWSSRTPR